MQCFPQLSWSLGIKNRDQEIQIIHELCEVLCAGVVVRQIAKQNFRSVQILPFGTVKGILQSIDEAGRVDRIDAKLYILQRVDTIQSTDLISVGLQNAVLRI